MRWKPKHARPRYWLGKMKPSAVGGVALVVLAVVGLWAALSHHGNTGAHAAAVVTIQASDSPAASASAGSGSPSSSAATTATAHPVSIDIPAINVNTTLQDLGLDSTGALAPPTNLTQAGWYTGSSVPGQDGPSVIAGHVDSYKGPAVFFQLKLLKPGDTITVGLSSGQHVVFAVTVVQQYPKDEFPTSDVYGARPDPELRLITCGGGFSSGHYLDNVVVYAALHA